MFADRLKKSLLQAAIQGQLTKQLSTDGDARDLLKKIRVEKAKLFAEKKIKAEKSLPPITDDEIPFELPANWCWCRLGEISDTNIGLTYSPQNIVADGIVVLRSGNIFNDRIEYRDLVKVNLTIPENKMATVGDILICVRNGSKRLVGKAAIIDKDGVSFGAFMAVVRSAINPYIFKVISSPYFRRTLIDEVGTTTINQITQHMLKNFLIPLPPLSEQKRIVARLEELLAEVNQLAHDERELNTLEENFRHRLKSSLLQAAIQGKLTEQLPNDGDAHDLLRKIRAEKDKLITEKKIKADKLLPPISNDEVPFDLPDNWCWCRLGEVCNYGNNETILLPAMEHGKLLIELEDIEKNTGKLLHRKFFDGTNANSSKNIFRRGQILFGKLRVYLNKVIVADDDGYCSSEILPLDFGKNILSRYAQIVLMSPTFLSYANSCSYGTKMPRLGTKAGQLALFPMPPLAEQKRIVERLEKLLPLCTI